MKCVEICNDRYRYKHIATGIANFVFHATFFIALAWVAEISFEAVVQHKAVKTVRYHSLGSFEYFRYGGTHIVKFQAYRYAAYV